MQQLLFKHPALQLDHQPKQSSGQLWYSQVGNKAELETFGTMVAAHRRRRRAQLPKRRKLRVTRRTRRRKLLPKRRKPLLKRRKPQLKRRKPQQKRGNHHGLPRRVLKHPYDEFISKILRQLNRDKVYISNKAKGKMISFIRKFYNKKVKRISIVGAKELQNALKRMMHKDQAAKLIRTIRKVSRHRCR
uniref:Uncharacterized protein n=1 Tax=Sphaerodactylus townsendi TaxID=933632 RepID=A0ACB8EGL0_9SAUR